MCVQGIAYHLSIENIREQIEVAVAAASKLTAEP